MEGLPKRLPIGQVTLKSYLPDLKIYLSQTLDRTFVEPCLNKFSQLVINEMYRDQRGEFE